MPTTKKRLKLQLVRSLNGRVERHQACVRGLGLRRLHQIVIVDDTLPNRGMINKVGYLLKVEEVE